MTDLTPEQLEAQILPWLHVQTTRDALAELVERAAALDAERARFDNYQDKAGDRLDLLEAVAKAARNVRDAQEVAAFGAALAALRAALADLDANEGTEKEEGA